MADLARVSVWVSRKERELLEAAADQSHTNLSDFIRRNAIEAAEVELLQRTRVVIPASKWKKFEAWVNRPAKNIPALKKLSKNGPTSQG